MVQLPILLLLLPPRIFRPTRAPDAAVATAGAAAVAVAGQGVSGCSGWSTRLGS